MMGSGDSRRRWAVALVAVPLAVVAGWLLLRHGAGGAVAVATRVLPGLGLMTRGLLALIRLGVLVGLPLLALYLIVTAWRGPTRKDDGDGRKQG